MLLDASIGGEGRWIMSWPALWRVAVTGIDVDFGSDTGMVLALALTLTLGTGFGNGYWYWH